MINLTLTHNLRLIITWATFSNAVGIATLSAHLQARWLPNVQADLVYCATSLAVALLGVILFPIRTVFSDVWIWELIGIGIGLLAVQPIKIIDLAISRHFLRREPVPNRGGSRAAIAGFVHPRMTRVPERNGPQGKDRWLPFSSLGALLLAAILEEIIFRGDWRIFAAQEAECYGRVGLIAASILAYGLLHLSSGLAQVVAKSVVGLILFGLAERTGTITPAIVAHMGLNFLYWRAAL